MSRKWITNRHFYSDILSTIISVVFTVYTEKLGYGLILKISMESPSLIFNIKFLNIFKIFILLLWKSILEKSFGFMYSPIFVASPIPPQRTIFQIEMFNLVLSEEKSKKNCYDFAKNCRTVWPRVKSEKTFVLEYSM